MWQKIRNSWHKIWQPKPQIPTNGMTAYDQGYKLEDNPFRQHTADHSIWRDDWLFSAERYK